MGGGDFGTSAISSPSPRSGQTTAGSSRGLDDANHSTSETARPQDVTRDGVREQGRGRGQRRNRRENARGRGPNGAFTTGSNTEDLTYSGAGDGISRQSKANHENSSDRKGRGRSRGQGRGRGRGQGRRRGRGGGGTRGGSGEQRSDNTSSKPEQAKPTALQTNEEEEPPLCVVCAEELRFVAIGQCNHHGRCSMCAMRSRVLLKDRSCPECKTVLDRLVVSKLPDDGVAPSFNSFNLWGDFGGPDADFDDASGMIFYGCKEHYREVSSATGLYCPISGCRGAAAETGDIRGTGKRRLAAVEQEAFLSKGDLLDHLKERHHKFFCGLCLEHRPLFYSEQQVFVSGALKKHEAQVDGHPLCRFCAKRFFDKAALYAHMTSTHITCPMCPEEHQYRYFRGEPQLRDHLRTSHFYCDRGECANHGVISAFNTAQELQTHLRMDHGILDSRAAVGFNIRRSARDGTGTDSGMDDYSRGGGFGGGVGISGAGGTMAAPDPDADLIGGFIVPAPQSQGQAAEGAVGGLGARGGLSGDAPPFVPIAQQRGLGSGGGGDGRSTPFGRMRAALATPSVAGAWRATASASEEEAFPSLPTPTTLPSRPNERHELSLVGRPGSRGSAAGVASSAKAAGVGVSNAGRGKSPEEEDEKRLLMRNKRVAEALGIRAVLGTGAAVGGAKVGTSADGSAVAMGIGDGLDAIRDHLMKTNYSSELVEWARGNRAELLKVERRLTDLVNNRKATSTQFKPMPSTTRRFIHTLAAYYGLLTQSYDLEPKRYVSAIKQKGCHVPGRLLSVAIRDPGYKGTDEAAPDASSTPLPSAASSSTMITSGPPRISTVTSISSTPSSPARAAEGSTRAASAVHIHNNTGNASSLRGSSSSSVTTVPAVPAGPSSETMVILYSVKGGLGPQKVFEAVKRLVPPRMVVCVRPAKSSEIEGPANGVLVAEFTNALNARRARERIEQHAEQLIAASRITRTTYDVPFRARQFPSASGASSKDQGSSGGDSVGVAAQKGEIDLVRDNWDSSDDEGVHDDGDHGSCEPRKRPSEAVEVSGMEERDASENGEPVAKGSAGAHGEPIAPVTALSSNGCIDSLHTPNPDVLESSFAEGEPGDTPVCSPRASAPGDGLKNGVPEPDSKMEGTVPRGAEGERGLEEKCQEVSDAAPAPKHHSRWGNSVIRGQLNRPSDGRLTMAEVEAKERQERVERLRRLDEARRESRKQKDAAKRAERANAGRRDAQAFIWENLGDSSSSSETDGDQARASSMTGIEEDGRVSTETGVLAEQGGQEGEEEKNEGTNGWACEICTFWNVTDAVDVGRSADGGSYCEMCGAQGPSNAGSPWLRA